MLGRKPTLERLLTVDDDRAQGGAVMQNSSAFPNLAIDTMDFPREVSLLSVCRWR
jgi:hypothetical protein